MKRFLKCLAFLIALAFLTASVYVGYVLLSYGRIEDQLALPISGEASAVLKTGTTYLISTSNIGFGAYSADYSFFLDGGKYSRALSREAVMKNTAGIASVLAGRNADIMLFQEVDLDSDRSHHVDQRKVLEAPFTDYQTTYAINYDTPFLYYPLTQPIGQSKSSIMMLSRFPLTDATRYALPIMEDFSKLFDLDRCFTVAHLPVANGKILSVFNVHMSAYLKDEGMRDTHVKTLMDSMKAEYEKGHYVICGGDFNHDLIGDSARRFGFDPGDRTWATPFPMELLPVGFTIHADDNSPSCRDANEPYQPGQTFVVTIDGFIASDNVLVQETGNLYTGFEYSDHTPVIMKFRLL